MTPKQEAALRLALEALEYIHEGANNQGPHTGISWRCVSNKAEPAITAIREALADSALDRMAENARELGLDYEPAQQQEPVGYTSQSWLAQSTGGQFSKRKDICGDVALYTSPQPSKPWVGLTDEQIDRAIAELGLNYFADAANNRAVLRELCKRAAHGIKGDA